MYWRVRNSELGREHALLPLLLYDESLNDSKTSVNMRSWETGLTSCQSIDPWKHVLLRADARAFSSRKGCDDMDRPMLVDSVFIANVFRWESLYHSVQIIERPIYQDLPP